MKIYFEASLEIASITHELGYGSCMNSSGLFVALCRSVNLPARKLVGVVYAHDDIGGYYNHHQWAEMLDESGFWHPLDFEDTTYLNLGQFLYPFKKNHSSGLYISCVGLIGIDMHSKIIIWIYPYQNVSENKFTIS